MISSEALDALSVPSIEKVLDSLEEAFGSLTDVVIIDRTSGIFKVSQPGIASTDIASLVHMIIGNSDSIPDWLPVELHRTIQRTSLISRSIPIDCRSG